MTEQPLSEVSTERLLDEVISRTDGLEVMRKRLQGAVVNGILENGETVRFPDNQPGEKKEGKDERAC